MVQTLNIPHNVKDSLHQNITLNAAYILCEFFVCIMDIENVQAKHFSMTIPSSRLASKQKQLLKKKDVERVSKF